MGVFKRLIMTSVYDRLPRVSAQDYHAQCAIHSVHTTHEQHTLHKVFVKKKLNIEFSTVKVSVIVFVKRFLTEGHL